MNNKKTIVVITGQTATGKTGYALEIAKKKDREVISADSRQAYQFLDIISGKDLTSSKFYLVKKIKPDLQIGYYQENSCRIWLYDILNPKHYFSAYDWVRCLETVIKILNRENKVPTVVGGSYFYIHSWLYGLPEQGVDPNWQQRAILEKQPLKELQKELKSLDLNTYNNLNESDRKNKRRLIRWIEKKSPKEMIKKSKTKKNWSYELIGLRYKSKKKLEEAIVARVEQRIKQGAIQEVELLLRLGYSFNDPGLKTIGYQQIIKYLHDDFDLPTAKQEWIKKELQYAKRQWTLMKRNKKITWHNVG